MRPFNRIFIFGNWSRRWSLKQFKTLGKKYFDSVWLPTTAGQLVQGRETPEDERIRIELNKRIPKIKKIINAAQIDIIKNEGGIKIDLIGDMLVQY